MTAHYKFDGLTIFPVIGFKYFAGRKNLAG